LLYLLEMLIQLSHNQTGGVTETFAKVASNALKICGIDHEIWHLDSTTISFEDSQAIKIVHGHAKQRPD